MDTQKWVQDGKIVLVGIALESHADRNQLFSQWHGFEFPILHDPLNTLGAKAVPIVVAIDEFGIVRAVDPSIEELEEKFINQTFSQDRTGRPLEPAIPDVTKLQAAVEKTDSYKAWIDLGDALAMWHSPARLGDAISAFTNALKLKPEDGATLFRLGMCYNMRYESERRVPGDFQRAVDKWSEALATDPSQYIWRRRIQQYGPRSDKPYPFYNWTDQAAAEIRERGEEPVALRIKPTRSEASEPADRIQDADKDIKEPDPLGLTGRDTTELIRVDVAAVPSRTTPGGDVRVHVDLRPNKDLKAHWNNETEPLQLWLDLPEDWKAANRLHTAPQPAQTESDESRHFDFGIKAPEDAKPGSISIPAYALYYVCEDIKGTCRYLRQDLKIVVEVTH